MTEIAFQSRKDVGTPTYYPKTYTELAAAAGGKERPEGEVNAGGKETPEGEVNAAIRTLTTYIPTEILTLYVAVLAALGGGVEGGTIKPNLSRWIAFWTFLVATPAVTWIVYATKVMVAGKAIPGTPSKWPLWEMAAGSIAYFAWAFALPGSPFGAFTVWYSSAVAGLVVLVTSTVLGLVAPLFARAIQP